MKPKHDLHNSDIEKGVIANLVLRNENYDDIADKLFVVLAAIPTPYFSYVGINTGPFPSGDFLSDVPYIKISVQLSPITNTLFI